GPTVWRAVCSPEGWHAKSCAMVVVIEPRTARVDEQLGGTSLTPDIATVASPRAIDLFPQAPPPSADAGSGDFDRVLRDVSAADRPARSISDRPAADRGAPDRAASDRDASDRGAPQATSDAAPRRNTERSDKAGDKPRWRA